MSLERLDGFQAQSVIGSLSTRQRLLLGIYLKRNAKDTFNPFIHKLNLKYNYTLDAGIRNVFSGEFKIAFLSISWLAVDGRYYNSFFFAFAQVHELPQSYFGDNREDILFL